MGWVMGLFIGVPVLGVLVFVVGCYLAEAVRKQWRRR